MDPNDHASNVDAILRRLEIALQLPESSVAAVLAALGHATFIDGHPAWDSMDRINRIIALMDIAAAIVSVDHPSRVVALTNWADALLRRFTMTQSREDVDAAILKYEEALQSCADDVHNCVSALISLGDALLSRFELTGALGDLDRLITTREEAVQLTPVDLPAYANYLQMLGAHLTTRFEITGSIEDIDRAIETLKQAEAVTLIEDPMFHAALFSNLGKAFLIQFKRGGVINHLDHAIEKMEDAIRLIPMNDPHRALVLNNLGPAFMRRFETTGSLSDIDLAIEKMEEAIRLIPMNDPHHGFTLSNLGTAFLTRFETTGLTRDIDHAIGTMEQALKLVPVDHRHRAGVLNNLGSTLLIRFRRSESMVDLENAIKALEQSLALVPEDQDHPERAAWLSNFGNALMSRFWNTGSMEDLHRGIDVKEQALRSTPITHIDYASKQNSLAATMHSRFLQTGSMDDLDSAIELMKRCVASTQTSCHSGRAIWTMNLATTLMSRFGRTGSMEDIDMAIETMRQAVDLSPVDHIDHKSTLEGLGRAFLGRSQTTGSMEDVDCAITTIQRSLEITPTGHPERRNRLTVLGAALLHRFKLTGLMEDLDSAIDFEEEAVRLTPVDRPDLAKFLHTLGTALRCRFERIGAIEDRDRAIEILKQAANCDTASTLDRLEAAQACATFLVNVGMLSQAAQILEAAVHLLPKVGPRELKRADSQFNISQFTNITTRAVSLCLENKDDPYKCLQLLELGRGILANLQLVVRSDISELADEHPELAQRFQTLRDEIDSSSTSGDPLSQGDTSPGSSDMVKVARRRRRLFKDFDALVVHVRTLTGFENFLKGPSKAELRSLAEEGPIAVFNVSDIRSDVFLITAKDEIRSIHLPDLSPALLHALANKNIRNVKSRQTNRAGTSAQAEDHEDDEVLTRPERDIVSKRPRFSTSGTESILRILWFTAVKPVLTELGFMGPPEDKKWPRIWWMTSGLLSRLPLHAAGDYEDRSTENTLDRVISSYIPSLKSMKYARDRKQKWSKEEVQKCLLVAMPVTKGQSSLPGAAEEIEKISSLIPNDERKTVLVEPIKMEVVQCLPECQIAHFACHGESRGGDPSQSRLLFKDWMSDGLSVADISKLKLEKAQFVYLSACSAAENREERLLDEAIHLTGACQLAGFGSVIGTLWQIDDDHSVEVALVVYREMIGTTGKVDSKKAGLALHLAIRGLRDKLGGGGRAIEWAPYIHVGI